MIIQTTKKAARQVSIHTVAVKVLEAQAYQLINHELSVSEALMEQMKAYGASVFTSRLHFKFQENKNEERKPNPAKLVLLGCVVEDNGVYTVEFSLRAFKVKQTVVDGFCDCRNFAEENTCEHTEAVEIYKEQKLCHQ